MRAGPVFLNLLQVGIPVMYVARSDRQCVCFVYLSNFKLMFLDHNICEKCWVHGASDTNAGGICCSMGFYQNKTYEGLMDSY
jgi:hypothetical protein